MDDAILIDVRQFITSGNWQKTELNKAYYRISSFKHRGVYLILRLLGAAFNTGRRLVQKIKTEEIEIMCQLKTTRHFLNHAV